MNEKYYAVPFVYFIHRKSEKSISTLKVSYYVDVF